MSSAPVVSIDPAAFWADPYPILAEMRASAPICYVPEIGATLITRRDDIHTCEKNVAVFSSEQPGGLMNVLMGRNMMQKMAMNTASVSSIADYFPKSGKNLGRLVHRIN